MSSPEIPRRRLANQRLIDPLPSPLDVVRWLGPVQAQDYGAAKWAIGQRARDATEAEIDQLFNDGLILRTHVLRPTWHFVLPEDIRWLLALTGPRIRRQLTGRHRQLGIDQDFISRANAVFGQALKEGQHMSRTELGQALRHAGVAPDGQRPHLLMAAELDAVIVSGPRRGKELTYALFDERVPQHQNLTGDEAAAELAGRYFRSHGPAQLQDYAWWCGLTISETRRAVALAGLSHELVEGREHWFHPGEVMPQRQATVGHLLPNFDEYTVGYTDRSAIVDPDAPLQASQFSYGNILSNVLTIDGVVRGGWRRTSSRMGIRVELRVLARLGKAPLLAVEQATDRLARFVGRGVEVAIS